MQLILTKTEVKRGLMGGTTMFTLAAKVLVSEQEREAFWHFRLQGAVFYKSEGAEHGPKQYIGADGPQSLAARFLLKQTNLEITGMNLISGLTFENESLLHLLDLEERVKEAANLFSVVVGRAIAFLGEEKIDLPMV